MLEAIKIRERERERERDPRRRKKNSTIFHSNSQAERKNLVELTIANNLKQMPICMYVFFIVFVDFVFDQNHTSFYLHKSNA